ncbi:MAG: deoxyribodipyrimidine photo-lyase [Bacteroidota bacterium]
MPTDLRRIHILKAAEPLPGPVVYWMQRDQRVVDNWALLYAQEQALIMKQPLLVVFCLVQGLPEANIRQYGFMIKGLAVAARRLARFHIPFILLYGLPQDLIPRFLVEHDVGMLVTDFNPLHAHMEWRRRLAEHVVIPFHEVDAHNIIPCRYISDKPEYAAFTLRKKVERLLPEFLTGFPTPMKHPRFPVEEEFSVPDWPHILKSLQVDREVPEVDWILPGEGAACEAMAHFLAERLDKYDQNRNMPDRKGQSDLSPYLHFGHLSAQRLAVEVQICDVSTESRKAFLEELIVRRELSDNFCLYNPHYDRFAGFQPWAKASLNKHRDDVREYCYSEEQFEKGQTHDPLWNAAHLEMVSTGKMHGYLRMYWAKKILEWSASPEDAMAIALHLNDKYELDGRDPNGYAGIAWSIGGTHDRPWGDREIFGMIRYMNYQGCKRKFDVNSYIRSNAKS